MEYKGRGDIEGDAYMNVTVNFTMAEANNTEVEQEFVDFLIEIGGQKAFPCTQCDGGLGRINTTYQFKTSRRKSNC